jgi:hypothetical protein
MKRLFRPFRCELIVRPLVPILFIVRHRAIFTTACRDRVSIADLHYLALGVGLTSGSQPKFEGHGTDIRVAKC